MATLPPSPTRSFPDDSLEKQVYNLVDKFAKNIPVENDRYRLGYTLYKYLTGEGDPPEVLVKSTKIQIDGMTREELAGKLTEGLKSIK